MYRVLFILFIGVIFANANENFIELGIRYRNFDSKLNTNITDKILTSYDVALQDEKSDMIGKFYFAINPSIFEYYIKTAEMEAAIEFGVKYKNYDFGFLQELQQEAYVNPYLLNQNRDETKIDTKGVYFGYNLEFEKYIYLNFLYKIKQNYYDNDGLKDTNLARNSTTHIIKGVYNYLFFYTALEYQKSIADGEGNSNDRYGVEFELKAFFSKLFLLTRVGFYSRDFKIENSYFNEINEIQKNDERLILFYAKYNKLLSFKNTYLAFSYKFDKVKSNLNIFDENIKAYNLTIGYKF